MSSGDVVVDKHVADYIDTPTEGTFENQQGSIVIRSPKTDKDGRLYLAANEVLLYALGVSTIQEAKNNEMDITVRDAITGEFVGQDRVSDNRLQGVIEGIDIEFDANYNLNVDWNTATRAFDFSSTDETTIETINIVDNSMDFQIGANEGQMMNAFISQIDAQALGITRVLLTDPEPAQESIRVLDEAIDMVSSERARIGAYANRLEYTMANLAAQRENTTAAESAIRDLDVARETTQLSISQILSQTSTAMLAQANQQAQGLMSLLR
jgi:flagellin